MKIAYAAGGILLLSMSAALAKDWGEMDGHQRRQEVIAYIKQNHYTCPVAGLPKTVAEQEQKLVGVPWTVVKAYIWAKCSQEQSVAASKPAAMQARAQGPVRATRAERVLTRRVPLPRPRPRPAVIELMSPNEVVQTRWMPSNQLARE